MSERIQKVEKLDPAVVLRRLEQLQATIVFKLDRGHRVCEIHLPGDIPVKSTAMAIDPAASSFDVAVRGMRQLLEDRAS